MNDHEDKDANHTIRERPTMAAELRAWLTVGIGLLINIAGTIWWAATLSADMRQLRESFTEIKAASVDRYTNSDARRDAAVINASMAEVKERLRDLERAAAANVRNTR